ncbi:MAG: 3-hydroxybutyryl-CoA dehydrogenase [Gemmatimonadaceae bacterium]
MTTIERVGVAGGGLMGSGIAQVSALGGCPTVLRELDEELCANARMRIERSMAKAIEKGRLTREDRDAALGRLSFATTLDALGDVDIIIEAVIEKLDAKRALWQSLDEVASAKCIFASNTSSLSVIDQATATTRGDRVIGMHFFNPVPQMKLVEVVRTVTTSDATFATCVAFARAIGKEPIEARDTPGFVVNLLLVPYMLDAIRALEGGVASIHDIDVGMQMGAGHPMGPLALCDFVGLDTLEKVAEIMWDAYRETRYAPPPLLRRMVAAGLMGKKGGLGFYSYAESIPQPNGSLR